MTMQEVGGPPLLLPDVNPGKTFQDVRVGHSGPQDNVIEPLRRSDAIASSRELKWDSFTGS